MMKVRSISTPALLSLTLFMIFSLMGLTACTAEAPAGPAISKLHIGSMPTQTAAIYAVAIDKGIFKKYGLDVDLTIFSSAVERDAAATAGKLDGFLTDIMGAVNLKEHGYDFTMTSSEYENFSLIANGKQSTKSLADLKGFKAGIANNTVTEYVLDTVAANAGLEKISVPKVPERLAALMSDNLQTAVFPEPFTTMIKAKGGHILVSSAEKDLQPVVFVFSSEIIKNQPKSAENFYKAYNEAVAYMKSTPYDDYKGILVSHKLVKPEMVDMILLPLDHYGPAKMVTEKDVTSVLAWMKTKSMIKNDYRFDGLTDRRFIP